MIVASCSHPCIFRPNLVRIHLLPGFSLCVRTKSGCQFGQLPKLIEYSRDYAHMRQLSSSYLTMSRMSTTMGAVVVDGRSLVVAIYGVAVRPAPAGHYLRHCPPQPTTEYDVQQLLLHMDKYANETYPPRFPPDITCFRPSRFSD
uniref:Profilin n=1 Tax=Angiostrongylus cantonensis TaxID=6313 RepID=A0A0K0CUL6_ANGCA